MLSLRQDTGYSPFHPYSLWTQLGFQAGYTLLSPGFSFPAIDALTEEFQTRGLITELETHRGAVEYTGASILYGAYLAKNSRPGQSQLMLKPDCIKLIYPRQHNELSAYIIASGVLKHGFALSTSEYGLVYGFDLSNPRAKGSQGNWVDEIPYAAQHLGLNLSQSDYMGYTWYEKQALTSDY